MFPPVPKEYYPIASRRSDDYGFSGSAARMMRVVPEQRFLAQTLREEA